MFETIDSKNKTWEINTKYKTVSLEVILDKKFYNPAIIDNRLKDVKLLGNYMMNDDKNICTYQDENSNAKYVLTLELKKDKTSIKLKTENVDDLNPLIDAISFYVYISKHTQHF